MKKRIEKVNRYRRWKEKKNNKWYEILLHNQKKTNKYGKEILQSPNFKKSAHFIQHGNISVKKHSISVALMALKISRVLPIKTNEKDIVRGALLHDYFLYDWHNQKFNLNELIHFYKMHGFTHPSTALKNANQEFKLTKREKDIIKKHMWPLTIVPPMCREAWIVTLADKYCSLLETLRVNQEKHMMKRTRRNQVKHKGTNFGHSRIKIGKNKKD